MPRGRTCYTPGEGNAPGDNPASVGTTWVLEHNGSHGGAGASVWRTPGEILDGDLSLGSPNSDAEGNLTLGGPALNLTDGMACTACADGFGCAISGVTSSDGSEGCCYLPCDGECSTTATDDDKLETCYTLACFADEWQDLGRTCELSMISYRHDLIST
jgi:hypothetical protein